MGLQMGGLYPGGLICEITYSFENIWAYIQGGGLKSGILQYCHKNAYCFLILIP